MAEVTDPCSPSMLFFVAVVFAAVTASPLSQNLDLTKPLLSSSNSQTIPDEYIIVFDQDAGEDTRQSHFQFLQLLSENLDTRENSINHVYNIGSFSGYSGTFQEPVIDLIKSRPEIKYIERDQIVHAIDIQEDAPWGLARISHRERLNSKTRKEYVYDSRGGKNVTAYIIDTGIYINHVEFGGRARWGATIPRNDRDIDGNGHGTHCAGTIASAAYGVAKQANVVAVKVLGTNGSGTMSDVVKGVEWAVSDHIRRKVEAQNANRPFKGSVANMSLGGGYSRSLNAAVNAAVDAGVHFAVAAGNEDDDACDYSPSSAENVVSVGASTVEDERAWFSNKGECVDVFAPGRDVLSTWIGSKTATNTISGTSMASPHVAGLMAYIVSLAPSDNIPKPKKLKAILRDTATKHALRKVPKDTPNLLVYNSPPSEDSKPSEDHQDLSAIVLEILESLANSN